MKSNLLRSATLLFSYFGPLVKKVPWFGSWSICKIPAVENHWYTQTSWVQTTFQIFCKKWHVKYKTKIWLKIEFLMSWQWLAFFCTQKPWLQSVRRLTGSLWANIKLITLAELFNQPTCFVYCSNTMGSAVLDYNKRLILLSVIQLSNGHCNI
jgi:hypothetical protein